MRHKRKRRGKSFKRKSKMAKTKRATRRLNSYGAARGGIRL